VGSLAKLAPRLKPLVTPLPKVYVSHYRRRGNRGRIQRATSSSKMHVLVSYLPTAPETFNHALVNWIVEKYSVARITVFRHRREKV